MNRHAGPPGAADAPAVPEPTYAERARTLAHLDRTGTLATVSRKHAGHPFASMMPYALDERGRPLLLISSMAVHTQNLLDDARASLLITQPTAGDPLAAGRLTLMGAAAKVPDADRTAVRAAYLARHANAGYWVDFDDFSFWRIEPADAYFVGGFAAMGWITSEEYMAARPDPLADRSEAIVADLNRDQSAALLAYARKVASAAVDEAALVTVDRLGFKLRLRSNGRVNSLRVAFPGEVDSEAACRAAFEELFRPIR